MRSSLGSRSGRASQNGTSENGTTTFEVSPACRSALARRLTHRNWPGVYVAPLVSAALLSGGLWNAPSAQADAPANATLAAPNDDTGPVVTIMKPGYSEQVKGSTQILIAVQSRRFTPQTIEFFVDDRSVNGGPIKLSSLPSAAFNWPTDQYADGPHKLTARVTDTQGFIGQAEVVVYINNLKVRDATPPALSWLQPKSGDVLRGTVNIELKAVDNFGVKYIIAMLNPADKPDQKPSVAAWYLNVPPYILKLDTTRFPDGIYVLKGLAWDALENEGAAPTISIGISNNSINPTWAHDLTRKIQTDSHATQPAAVTNPDLPRGPYTTETAPANPTTAKASNTTPQNPGPSNNASNTSGNLAQNSNGNTGQLEAMLPPNSTRPHHDVGTPYTSLSVSHAPSNGTREGAVPASPSNVSVQRSVQGAQIGLCASIPPLNPRSLPNGKSSAQTSAHAANLPNIPSPVINLGGNGTHPAFASGAPTVLRPDNGSPTAARSVDPRIARNLPGHPAIGDLAPRAGGSTIVSHSDKPKWTVASGVGEGTPVGPNQPSHNGTDKVRVAVRPVEPNGTSRTTSASPSHNVPTVMGDGLTKLPSGNESRAVNAGTPGSPDSTNDSHSLRPSLPRVSALPPLSGAMQNHSKAAITVAPMSQWVGRATFPVSYVAQRDETLQAIAAHYNLPVSVLAATNNMAATARLAA
ncbi:MAG: hypothetical protein JOZ57_17780, partial [Abitibacteriaceae bacterium]|nr:hypothetical protein [Abditibacteriaceae bacterium]